MAPGPILPPQNEDPSKALNGKVKKPSKPEHVEDVEEDENDEDEEVAADAAAGGTY